MQGIRICMLDTHERYAEKLMDYMNHNQTKIPFLTRIFTGIDTLNKFLQKKETDILLVGEEICLEGICREAVKVILYLCDGKKTEDNNRMHINRYQSMEKIQKDLLRLYLQETEEELSCGHPKEDEVKIIGVFSPVGGSGTSRFSWALAETYSSFLGGENKVLLLNLELFPNEKKEDTGFSELAYYVGQKRKNVALCLHGLVKKHGKVDYLPGPGDFEDLLSFSEEDMRHLLEELKIYSGYQIIILDMGIQTKALLEAMAACTVIYMPHISEKTDNDISQNQRFKQINWTNQIRHRGKEEILGKVKEILLPRDEDVENGIVASVEEPGGSLQEFVEVLIEREGRLYGGKG